MGDCMDEVLAGIGRKIDLINEDFATVENFRDKTSAEPWSFDWMTILHANVVSEKLKPEANLPFPRIFLKRKNATRL